MSRDRSPSLKRVWHFEMTSSIKQFKVVLFQESSKQLNASNLMSKFSLSLHKSLVLWRRGLIFYVSRLRTKIVSAMLSFTKYFSQTCWFFYYSFIVVWCTLIYMAYHDNNSGKVYTVCANNFYTSIKNQTYYLVRCVVIEEVIQYYVV